MNTLLKVIYLLTNAFLQRNSKKILEDSCSRLFFYWTILLLVIVKGAVQGPLLI